MSEPEKPPSTESVVGGAKKPLGTPAESAEATSTTAPAARPEGGEDYETEDPFKFGWHHIDADLMKELATKPLKRLDEKDKVTTMPNLVEDGQVTVRDEVHAPVPTKGNKSRRGLWVFASCGAVAVLAAVLWFTGGRPSENAEVNTTQDTAESGPARAAEGARAADQRAAQGSAVALSEKAEDAKAAAPEVEAKQEPTGVVSPSQSAKVVNGPTKRPGTKAPSEPAQVGASNEPVAVEKGAPRSGKASKSWFNVE